MASTYTTAGIELIADGEQSTTWGDTTNTNWELMEELVAGVVSISLSSTTYTLTTTDGATSNGRHAVVVFTGSPGGTCTVTVSPNDMQKVYWIVNNSDETVTMSQGTGSNVSVLAGSKKVMYCDGAGSGAAVVDLSTNFDMTSPHIDGTEVTATAAELNLIDGSSAGTIVNSKAVIYGSSGEVNATTLQIGGTSLTASATELNYVKNVTSAIQTQLDAKVAKTSSTGSAVLPAGTTAQRDGSPSAGYLRWNSDDTSAEVYDGSGWTAVGGGNSTSEGLYEHAYTISSNYSITSGNNALSAGPITINSGVSVTVPTGSTWVIA